jgi:AraC-like DNA-binding protein
MDLPLGVRKYQHWSSETKAFEDLCLTVPFGMRPGASSAVVDEVRNLVATRALTLNEAAAVVGMSNATLQRRLHEAGTCFRSISKEARCAKLVSLLSTDLDFDDVAEELGLSERRSLWRTCQDWLGVSPSEYRRAHRVHTQSPIALQNSLINRHIVSVAQH